MVDVNETMSIPQPLIMWGPTRDHFRSIVLSAIRQQHEVSLCLQSVPFLFPFRS